MVGQPDDVTVEMAAWLRRRCRAARAEVQKAWPLFREKYAALIPAAAPSIVEQALARVPEVFGALSRCPATLTHGDVGLDNVRFDLPDAPLAVYDWQLVLRAPAARDVAWFLARSLPVEQRRRQEDRLVRTYHEALVAAGVRDYPLETLQRHILLGYLQALYSVISAGVNADFSTERGAR